MSKISRMSLPSDFSTIMPLLAATFFCNERNMRSPELLIYCNSLQSTTIDAFANPDIGAMHCSNFVEAMVSKRPLIFIMVSFPFWLIIVSISVLL